MDLSLLRSALNGFSDATPVKPADLHGRDDHSAFLPGENARLLPEQIPPLMDLNTPSAWDIAVMDDFTRTDALEIDYPCGQDAPAVSLLFIADANATEVRLDGVKVALVRMRYGHGPLRASAIKLIPDLSLAGEFGAQST